MPACNYTYPIPYELSEKYGIRRYGFHGISVEYVFNRACKLMSADPMHTRMIVAHLGAGCSATAVRQGKSVDTTMGLTPLDGLMMGTRAGSGKMFIV